MNDPYAGGGEQAESNRIRDRWVGIVVAVVIGATTGGLYYWVEQSALVAIALGAGLLLFFLVPILLATSRKQATRDAFGCFGCFVTGIQLVVAIFAILAVFGG